MRQFLFNLFKRYFPRQFFTLEIEVITAYTLKQNVFKREERIKEMETLIDQPVICIPNEYANPIVGFVKEVKLMAGTDVPAYVVLDELSDREVLVYEDAFEFSQGLFQFIFSSDRMRLNDLLYKEHAKARTYRMPPDALMEYKGAVQKLSSREFFVRVAKIWEQQRHQDGHGVVRFSATEPALHQF